MDYNKNLLKILDIPCKILIGCYNELEDRRNPQWHHEIVLQKT